MLHDRKVIKKYGLDQWVIVMKISGIITFGVMPVTRANVRQTASYCFMGKDLDWRASGGASVSVYRVSSAHEPL